MAQEPTVLTTSPSNYATKVSVTSAITADFDIDLDPKSLDNHVYLTNSHGVRIDGRVVYRRKKIIFTPLQPLEPGTSYQFFLIGDSNLEDGAVTGIRNLMGSAMRGNTVVSFTTESAVQIDPPGSLQPADGSLLRQMPLFSWSPVSGAVGYDIRVSTSNRYETLFFSSDRLKELQIEPNITWQEGIYYWSVRSIRDDGVASPWSPSRQFNYSLLVEGTISEEDAPPIEVMYEELDTELEVVEVFPADGSSDIPINVKSIFFRVIGDVDVSLIDVDSFKIVGRHITGDYEEESHGEVAGRFAIVKDSDSTTYIVFTPDPLPEPETES